MGQRMLNYDENIPIMTYHIEDDSGTVDTNGLVPYIEFRVSPANVFSML
jgi:hypothetical protein